MADGFLGRWSRRKQDVREGKPVVEPPPPAPALAPQAAAPVPAAAAAPIPPRLSPSHPRLRWRMPRP